MSDKDKELIKGFIEQNWTFFEQYLVRQGFTVAECEDKAIELVEELEQA